VILELDTVKKVLASRLLQSRYVDALLDRLEAKWGGQSIQTPMESSDQTIVKRKTGKQPAGGMDLRLIEGRQR